MRTPRNYLQRCDTKNILCSYLLQKTKLFLKNDTNYNLMNDIDIARRRGIERAPGGVGARRCVSRSAGGRASRVVGRAQRVQRVAHPRGPPSLQECF